MCREWLFILLLTLSAAVFFGKGNGVSQTNRLIYDRLIESIQRPAPEDIVIVAIDEASIAAIGRWPWKRGNHAQLINILSSGAPRAIGLDIILSESENDSAVGVLKTDDAALAAAISKNAHTILPVFMQPSESGLRATLPRPEFESAAFRLGHIHLNFDADDVVRSVYLNEGSEGNDKQRWPEFAQALLEAGGGTSEPITGKAAHRTDRSANLIGQEKDTLLRIPFYGPPGHFPTVSYADVLQGRILPQFFQHKYVLVGATAIGLSDAFPTSLSAGQGLMSGVEIHANILASLIEGRSITSVSSTTAIIFTALPALLTLIAYLYLSPRSALLFTTSVALLVSLTCYIAFKNTLWIPPSGALILLLVVYPIWSWRRLETAISYLDDEYQRLHLDAPLTVSLETYSQTTIRGFLERRIAAMRDAASHIRDLRQFVSDTLDSMPNAELVVTDDGTLTLYNRKAQALFLSLNLTPTRGRSVAELFAAFDAPQRNETERRRWREQLSVNKLSQLVSGVEARDATGRIFRIKASLAQKANGDSQGWIISIADITVLRNNEQLRDEGLRFISHDMRAPQSSILAMLELQKNSHTALALDELYARIEKSVLSTLTLADDFVFQAKAELKIYQFEETDFSSILADATDEMWALANQKSIRVVTTTAAEEAYMIKVDRSLMVRALCNLISNAIKYSPSDSLVSCSLSIDRNETPVRIVCEIADQGCGISKADRATLFSPFYRENRPLTKGAGLGLTFVKTVVEQHGGTIDFVCGPTKGTTFTMALPCLDE